MFEAVVSLVLATALLLGSPGPVPIALGATGASYGPRQGVSFLFGILSGLVFAIVFGSLGVAALFSAFPTSRYIVGIAGALYILYLAAKIATATIPAGIDESVGTAPTFRDGFILNLLNPKAYAAFAALFSQFLLPFSSEILSIGITALVAFLVAIIVDSTWLLLGGLLTPIFLSPTLGRPIRIVFGVSMVLAVVLAGSTYTA